MGFARAERPCLRDGLAQRGLPCDQEFRLAVLHRCDQFGGGLAGIERDYDGAFGHQGDVDGNPADGVGSEDSYAVVRLEDEAAEGGAGLLNLLEELGAAHVGEFVGADFAEDRARGIAVKLGEELVEEVGHG